MVITWRSHTGFTGRVTRYTVKWLQVGNPADSNVDGQKIVNAGSPYRRETQVGGLKPFTMYSFMVREEAGQDNWSKFSAPVDIIMPEDGKSVRKKCLSANIIIMPKDGMSVRGYTFRKLHFCKIVNQNMLLLK